MPDIPANVPASAIFARDIAAAVAAPFAHPYVAVIPHHSTWNDFGRYFGVRMWVFNSQTHVAEFNMHLMFRDVLFTGHRITQICGERGFVEADEYQQEFCSVLDDMDEYRRLFDLVDFDFGVSVLRKLGDAVVTEAEGVATERLALIRSTDFHYGALRSDRTYTAYRRASRYLTPYSTISFDDAAVSFEIRMELPSADNEYETTFDWSPDALARDRISVLIGRNGSGKTQFLLNAVRALREHKSSAAEQSAALVPVPSYSRVLVFSSVSSDPYPRVIQPWEGLDYRYFSMTAHRPNDEDALTLSLVDCLRDDGRIVFGSANPFAPAGRLWLLERSLRPLGIWEWIHFRLREPHDDLGIARRVGDSWYFPIAGATRLNEQRKLLLAQRVDWAAPPILIESESKVERTLSSGELAMLRFAAQASANVESGCALLFDEPETHLHPNFVSDFMDILYTLVTVTKSIAIIATHSAYVVREVPRQRVKVFSLEDRIIAIQNPRLQTFGASIDSISQFIFGDTDVSHRYQDILDQWVKELPLGATIESVVEEYGSQMNSETLSYVARRLSEREK